MPDPLSVPAAPCPSCSELAEHTARSRNKVDYHCRECNRPFSVWVKGGPAVIAPPEPPVEPPPDPSVVDAVLAQERTRDVVGSLRSARLVHVNIHPNQEYEVGLRTRVGRHPMCELQILDRSLEKEHFLLAAAAGGAASLTPLGDAKVFVDDELVTETVFLRAGQRICAGQVELMYQPWEFLERQTV